MTLSRSASTTSPFPASFWARLWGALSGWFSPSPPPSLPESSVTLDDDEEYVIEVSPEVARSLDRIKQVVEGLISGEIKGFVMFADEGSDVATSWYRPEKGNHEMMALAIQDYGHRLHLKVAAVQGTAPPNNRSDRKQ